MQQVCKFAAASLALLFLALVVAPSSVRAETRIALVVGNAAYQAGALNTPANDAGLIAQTLQAAGFDVVGARDLDQDTLRRAFRDFLDKATNSGPDTVAVIYLSGYGLQLEGENYFVPIDARIARAVDVPAEALRISDYTRPLAALSLKASIFILDGARASPFARSGDPLASGLALVEPEPGMLIAFNSAPGTVVPAGQGSYGPYAQALAEMMREGGLPLVTVFDRVRLRVNDMTKGAEVPWHASKVQAPFVFFERAPDAPPPAVSIEQTVALRARPIRDLDVQDAYVAALERDTLEGYVDFLAAYPDDPMAKRVRAIVAARREAFTWRRTRQTDTPPAYWSYLRRYPRGAHAADAHRRLAFLRAVLEPPQSFAVIEYDVPPPPPEEIIYIERPVLIFDDPEFAFAPPPPPPVFFLAPPPPEFMVLPPPPPPVAIFVLPTPIYRPVPDWVRSPAYVRPPPNNVIFNNIHNTVVINNTTNAVTITNRSGETRTVAPPAQPAVTAQPVPPGSTPSATGPAPAAPAAALVGPALPPSVAQKAITIQNQQPPGTQPSPPGQPQPQQPGQPTPLAPRPPLGQPLPGMPLPPSATKGISPSGPPAAPPPAVNGPPTQLQKGPSVTLPPPTQPGQPLPGTTAPPSATKSGPPPGPPAGSPPAVKGPQPPPAGAPPQPGQLLPKGPPSAPKTAPFSVPPAGPPSGPPPGGPPPQLKQVTPPPPPPAAVRPPPPPPPAAVRPPPPPPPAAVRPPPPPPPAAVRPPPPPPPAAVRPPPPPPPPPPPAAPRPPAAKQPPCGGPGQPACPK